MMHHQNLRSISSLLIGLLAILSRKGHIVQSFTAPIIRGTVIPTIAKSTIHANNNNNIRTLLPLFKSLPIIYSPRILTPCTTSVAVVLQAEPANIGDSDSNSNNDANEIIARRIIVVGDVDGGYYRSCVKNEASRFRKLIGTMSPPANEKRAEIYVEGKRKMVEGFVRWCKRGDIGLSQSIKVDRVIDEYPTGLYDDFYVATGRE